MLDSSFSVLTYNVEFNRALQVMPQIIEKYKPDIICLQEVIVGKKGVSRVVFPGYGLAAASGSFYRFGKTYGQANFYRLDKFTPLESNGILLPKTWYEMAITLFTRKGPRTALVTDFVKKGSGKRRLSVCNLHLTALQATNKARNKQLGEVLQSLDISEDQCVLVLGDFNYPFRKRSLERIIDEYNLSEATSDIIRTYAAQPWKYIEKAMNHLFPVSLKYDYILHTQALRCIETKLLEEFKGSDHCPVFSRLDFIPKTHKKIRPSLFSSPLLSPT